MIKYKIIYKFNNGTSEDDTNFDNYFETRDDADLAGMAAMSLRENNIRDFEIKEVEVEVPDNVISKEVSNTTGNDVRFCFKCGANISPGIVFCPYCGTPLNEQGQNVNAVSNTGYGYSNNRAGVASSYDATKNIYMVLCLIGGISCLAGLFLPYVSASFLGTSISKSLQELTNSGGDFPIFVAVAAIGIVLALFKQFLGCSIDGILFIVFHNIDTKDYWSNISSSSSAAFASKGVGYYAMLGGAACLILFGLVGSIEKIKYKHSLKGKEK